MCGRIAAALSFIAAGSYDFSPHHKHGSHGHLAQGRGEAGLLEGEPHEPVIFVLRGGHTFMIQAAAVP
jgi:hypothetical protein